MRLVIVMLSVIGLLVSVAQAADWEVDAAHSSIGFTVKHLMITNVKGTFTNFSGKAQFDPADPTKFVVEGKIAAASVDTGSAMRDGHLRSPDFFDVKQFPDITFKSKEIKKEGDGYVLTGDLAMHGVTNTIALQLKGLEKPVNFMGLRTAFSATGQIARDKFGLTWNKPIEAGGVLVGNEVQIAVEIELVQKVKPTAQ